MRDVLRILTDEGLEDEKYIQYLKSMDNLAIKMSVQVNTRD